MYRIAIVLFCLFSFPAWPQTPEEETYSFAIVPQQSAKRLAQLWTPIFNYLYEETGVRVQFTTAKNIPEFENQLANGAYDFAYMNPYHFTVFNQSPGYRAVARRDKQPIRGILVVRKDTTIKDLQALEDKRLAFPSPAAFAASVLPRAELKQQNIQFEPQYVSSHDSVYLSVARGLFVAGGGVKRTLNNAPPEVSEQLKILWETPAYTPHAIAAHPRIDKDIRQKIGDALAQLHTSKRGKALLASIKIKKRLVTAEDSDWDDVRALEIDLLNPLLEK